MGELTLRDDYGTDDFVYILSPPHVPMTNWSAHRIKIWGLQFSTVEHAYQYRKFIDVDPEWARKIKNADSPWEAKRMSRMRDIDPAAWDPMRTDVMSELIAAKVRQHADVRKTLMATGDRAIINCDSKDVFWGTGEHNDGLNTLGKIWIVVRESQHTHN